MIVNLEYIVFILIVVIYISIMFFFTYLGKSKYKEYMEELKDEGLFK